MKRIILTTAALILFAAPAIADSAYLAFAKADADALVGECTALATVASDPDANAEAIFGPGFVDGFLQNMRGMRQGAESMGDVGIPAETVAIYIDGLDGCIEVLEGVK